MLTGRFPFGFDDYSGPDNPGEAVAAVQEMHAQWEGPQFSDCKECDVTLSMF